MLHAIPLLRGNNSSVVALLVLFDEVYIFNGSYSRVGATSPTRLHSQGVQTNCSPPFRACPQLSYHIRTHIYIHKHGKQTAVLQSTPVLCCGASSAVFRPFVSPQVAFLGETLRQASNQARQQRTRTSPSGYIYIIDFLSEEKDLGESSLRRRVFSPQEQRRRRTYMDTGNTDSSATIVSALPTARMKRNTTMPSPPPRPSTNRGACCRNCTNPISSVPYVLHCCCTCEMLCVCIRRGSPWIFEKTEQA